MVKPPNILLAWGQLMAMIPGENNQVWEAFCIQFDKDSEKYLKDSNQEVTPENKITALKQLVVDFDHPVHAFLHVFKCSHCPETHKVEVPCFLIRFDTLPEDFDLRTPFRNVTLAFPVEAPDGSMLYSVHEGIDSLMILRDSEEDNTSLILVDSTMAELAVHSNSTTH